MTIVPDLQPLGVRWLEPAAVPEATDVLAEAFRNYPVMRFVLRESGVTYEAHLQTLVRFFTASRVHRGEPVLGIGRDGELKGVALVSVPGGPPSPPEVALLREETWAVLGLAARERYAAFSAASAALGFDRPRLHLNMIGVREAQRGMGVGHSLLRAVHELARTSPHAEGVSLSTEDPANLPLYQHFGYRITGHVRVAPTLETWALFRPDEA